MIFNMVGGGGGITKSIIVVIAPTGSTVTCSKGSVHKTATEQDGTWTFKGLDLGTWTVTWYLGEEQDAEDIEITKLEVIYITFDTKKYVVKDGVKVAYDFDGAVLTTPRQYTKTTGYGYLQYYYDGDGTTAPATYEKVDLRLFSKLYFDVMSVTGTDGIVGISSAINTTQASGTLFIAKTLVDTTERKTYVVDVSNLSDGYIAVNTAYGINGKCKMNIYNIWME